jgi:hypothetical protein
MASSPSETSISAPCGRNPDLQLSRRINAGRSRLRRLLLTTASAIALAAIFVWLVAAADLPPLTDGSDHGDPPFLIESGWKPLLNGNNLDGWELVDPGKKVGSRKIWIVEHFWNPAWR